MIHYTHLHENDLSCAREAGASYPVLHNCTGLHFEH